MRISVLTPNCGGFPKPWFFALVFYTSYVSLFGFDMVGIDFFFFDKCGNIFCYNFYFLFVANIYIKKKKKKER